MQSTIRWAGLGLLLGAAACLMQTLEAQTAPSLSIQMQTGYAGIMVTGTVSGAYMIEAATNVALTSGWVALTNVVLPSSPWVYIDYASLGMAKRFYRASAMITNTPPDTNAPSGMALIPAGSFTMGDVLGDGFSDELPLHTVYVSAFYLDKTEVTKALWDEVYQWATNRSVGLRYNFEYGADGKAASHPAQRMTWYDAVKWCNARSEKEGRVAAYYTDAAQTTVYRSGQVGVQNDWVKWNAGYRLPTEAEWEKAARGGASGHRFPWGDTITHSQANYWSSSLYSYDVSSTRGYHPSYDNDPYPYTSPVGSFAANGYGLYDMSGNVWEWCWDWYGSYASSMQNDPRGPSSGSYRVVRGGSWHDYAFYCRAADRDSYWPDIVYSFIGFRPVLAPGQ